MSELNKKLQTLSRQQPASMGSSLEPADIAPLPTRRYGYWLALACTGLLASGCVGWWFGSQPVEAVSAPTPAPVAVASHADGERVPEPAKKDVGPMVSSATPDVRKISEQTPVEEVVLARGEPEDSTPAIASVTELAPIVLPPPPASASPASAVAVAPAVSPEKRVPSKEARVKAAAVSAKAVQPAGGTRSEADAGDEPESGLVIETVALTPAQLADVEFGRAEKAMKEGNSRKAADYYEAALSYRPDWAEARQKLAALYYGRGDVRRALAILQEGLGYDSQQPVLRLTLARLLVSESQQQAALNVLAVLPAQPDSGYLAMRGALAQQLKSNNLALSSYQRLVELEPYDGRWWMGLGIALERGGNGTKAEQAYQQALLMGRISSQSQQFIQQRLNVLASSEG